MRKILEDGQHQVLRRILDGHEVVQREHRLRLGGCLGLQGGGGQDGLGSSGDCGVAPVLGARVQLGVLGVLGVPRVLRVLWILGVLGVLGVLKVGGY